MRPTRTLAVLLLASVAICLVGCACGPCADGGERPAASAVDPQLLVGAWKIDLRPTPDAEAYYQRFVVESVEGRTFTGSFYGSPVCEARLNGDWGALRFSFVTSDGSGQYLHSGVLRDGRLDGMSNSTGRDFLNVWRGERERH